MVEQLKIFIAFIFVFLGILGIFNARFVIRSRFKSKNENLAVNIFKVFSFFVCVSALVVICFLC